MEPEICLVKSQAAVNSEILSIIKNAQSKLTFISMMTEHSSPALLNAIRDALERGVDVAIFHSKNPYVSAHQTPHPANTISPHQHHYPSLVQIEMHGKRLPNFVSNLIHTHVEPMHTNVTHSRFIANDTHVLFGGVDYNETLDREDYVQHAVRISFSKKTAPNSKNSICDIFQVKKEFDSLVQYLRNEKSLLNYNFLPSYTAIIGTSSVNNSAQQTIMAIIKTATHRIFIENQYFQYQPILQFIVKRQKEVPNLTVIFVGNDNYSQNPYHPGHKYKIASTLGNQVLKQELWKSLTFMLNDSDFHFQFRVYKGNKYTHNKIFIVDDTIVIGTFNLHSRSLEAGGDNEIGILLRNQGEMIDKYIMETMDATIVNTSKT